MDYKDLLCYIREMGFCDECWDKAVEYVREKETKKINGDPEPPAAD